MKKNKLHEPLSEIARNCSLPLALETMGERWAFMILRASFNGLHHFEEFLEELGIARNILSNRLTRLVQSGILKRAPCEYDRRKVEYRLTEKGMDLLPTMIALRQWGEKWESGMPSNPVLVDERDRRPIAAIAIHSHDGRKLEAKDLCWCDREDLGRSHDADSEDDHTRKVISLLSGKFQSWGSERLIGRISILVIASRVFRPGVAIQKRYALYPGLLRRFAPRNDA